MPDFTFVCPVGVTKVQVECVGGGGNGRVGDFTGGWAGGGGGAYARKAQIPVIPGNSYLVRQGSAPGGESLFISNVTVRAEGGGTGGGTGGAGGQASNSVGDVKYSGGNGGSVVVNAGAGAGGGGRAGRGGDGIDGQSITALVAVPGGLGGGDGDGNLSGGDGGAGFDYFTGGHPGLPGNEEGAGGGGGGPAAAGTAGGAGQEGWIAIYDDTTQGGAWPPTASAIYAKGTIPPFPPPVTTARKASFVV